jgi:hypothetical protein
MASYGSDEGFTAWLAEQGYELPDDAPTAAVLRARGSAYVDGYERFWTGTRTDGVAQELAWPRTGATMNCTVAIDDDVIPPAVVNAAYRAAWLEASTPGVLTGSAGTAGTRVKRQKVETIEREFFDDGKAEIGGGPSFIDSQIDGLLSPFICDVKDGAFMWTLGC